MLCAGTVFAAYKNGFPVAGHSVRRLHVISKSCASAATSMP
jgi:hypothetical protein